MLLKQLSRYDEALECFEKVSFDTADWVRDSMNLQRQVLRDKLKPHEAGSKEAFETYCRVLGNFLKDTSWYKSEVEFAHKKLNENILQHIHKLDDDLDEDDFYETGEWLQNTDREKEALELYDKQIEKELEKGDLHMAAWANDTKAQCLSGKDAFDCYEKTIQFCEKSGSLDDRYVAHELFDAYRSNALTFKTFGNMDKAIEYIDHAIKLEREYGSDNVDEWWRKKVSWLPDEEAIKFLDEEIKAWQNSSYYDGDDKKRYIESMEDEKKGLLKKLAK